MQKLAAFLKRFHSGPAADACEFLGVLLLSGFPFLRAGLANQESFG